MAEHLRPTFTLKELFMTTGEGTSHTAMLVVCGFVLKAIGKQLSAWIVLSVTCSGNRMRHAYSPTSAGALSVKSSVSFTCSSCVASSLTITTASGAMIVIGLPRRSQPEGHDTLTFSAMSVPASTTGAND